MSTRDFAGKLKLVLKHEGGYVDHPRDPGGATNLGVTIGTLSAWLGRPATKAEVKALTVAKVTPIYKRQYWDKIAGDRLPEGLDYAVFDYAVNSGPGRGGKELQRVLGIPADGIVGLHTIAALEGKDPVALINALCDRRMKFLRGLKTWKDFGKGWTRRVEGVRAAALAMARAGEAEPIVAPVPVEPAPVAVPDDLGSAKADPADEAISKTGAGQAGGLAGIGAAGSAITEAAQQVSPLTYYLDVAKWIFLALMVVGVGLTLYTLWKKSKSQDSIDE